MKKNLKNIILCLIVFLSKIFKSNKIKIGFESNSDFSDSSISLYNYINENINNKNIKIYWFVDEKNYVNKKKYKKNNIIICYKIFNKKNIIGSIKSLFNMSSLDYSFYTHNFIGNIYNKKQIRVFLTHASPPVKDSTGFFFPYYYNTNIISTSDFSAKYRCKTLGGGENIVLKFGLPRNDSLYLTKKEKNNVLEFLKLKDYNKIIVWMPTFKHHVSNERVDFSQETKNDLSLLNEENMNLISEFLIKNKSYLIIKFHPAQDLNYVKEFKKENIIFLENNEIQKENLNMYNILGLSDALITDFSSVYFDYLLLNKPIGFDLSDFDNYKKGLGFVFENPLDFMPGSKIKNITEMMDFLDDIVSNKDMFIGERQKLLDLNHENKDNKSSERIVKYFNLDR